MSVSRILDSDLKLIVGINTPLVDYPALYAELVNLQNQINNMGPSNANLKRINNLSDVASVSLSRNNLGLGSASLLNTNQVLQPSNNLSDLNDIAVARTNLNLGSASLLNTNQVLQPSNNLNDLNDIAVARTNLNLGSASLLNTNQVLQPSNNLSEVSSPATARANIGADNASNLTSGVLSGSLLPSSTVNPLALVGISNGSAPAVGTVGEFLSTVMNRSDRIVCVAGDQIISSLNLTPGDYDVSGVAYFEADGGSTIISQVTGGLNTSSFGAPDLAQRILYNNSSLYNICSFAMPTIRVSSASAQTVYAWSLVTQLTGTVKCSMSIYARRVR